MLYAVSKRVVGAVARSVYRPKIIGAEKVPTTGPVILAPNHLAVLDSFIVPLVLPRPVAFLAKAEYFQGTGVKGGLSKWLFTSLGAIPVERGRGRAALEAIGAAEDVLRNGGAFGIHPEGTRSPDGRLYRGRTGVARLTLNTGAPVVPVALTGTDKLQPRGTKIPRRAAVTVRFGDPLDFTRYSGMEASLPVLRSITDEIMYSISELSDQEYVDKYQKPGAAAAA
ncbi:lysophospholipid acyltransferase family protein [Saccharopolyspora dendranthemae]|uniref:1-acyl-sn-glycerol-3-phosphate acyltransferase n=1 Tax=Saccharopolyspora dendranthemae TaxID=1181886 RepID=A0A561U3Y5_9PSEU|nr:lysophospholipid acyltransferase family protein [Saccharopolyspora dendranthemae]TWF94076.1 1-acyl-sn-glycerol-3-phosphate acyltransferase [Saccharopolyspora dendranthemae]